MISFDLSEEQAVIRASFQSFAEEVVAPQSRPIDDSKEFPIALLNALLGTGVLQGQVQGEEGDRSALSNALILEEIGAADVSTAVLLAGLLGFVSAILDSGTDEQRRQVLKGTGAEVALGMTCVIEPNFQFKVDSLTTQATVSGDRYSLNGRKFAVPLARRMDWFLAVAMLDGKAAAFIVPSNAPNLIIHPPKGSLALAGVELSELTFEDVPVPSEMKLGGDRPWEPTGLFTRSRVALAAILTGQSRTALAYAIPYLKQRQAHGSPLARKQAIAFRLADMHIDIHAMRWMVWRAATEIDQERDASRSALKAFKYAATQGLEIADEVLQGFGGHGFIRDLPVELWYRNARALSVLDGLGGV